MPDSKLQLSPWECHEGLGPLGGLCPRNHPSVGGANVTQHVIVNMTLPKDSDAGPRGASISTLRDSRRRVPSSMNGYGAHNTVPSHPYDSSALAATNRAHRDRDRLTSSAGFRGVRAEAPLE